MRKIKVGAVVALIVLSNTVSQGSFADDFGTHTVDTGAKADNGWHDYCTVYSWVPSWQQPLDDAMARLSSQTVMTTHWQSGGCSNWMDVQARVSNSTEMGSALRGSTTCVTGQFDALNVVCGGAAVLLNADLLTDYGQRRKTICHEVGHTVGLSHSSTATDCMISGSSTVDWYGSHHIAHINGAY